MARSLNKAQLIGNLTRDPELRYTPQGTAVCTFGLATNRQWVSEGQKKEDVEYHRLVAWNKLAELCSQLLTKGRKVYVEGRLQTRKWQGQDGAERSTTEIVISDMVILDSRGAAAGASGGEDFDIPDDTEFPTEATEALPAGEPAKASSKKTSSKKDEVTKVEEIADDDIPF